MSIPPNPEKSSYDDAKEMKILISALLDLWARGEKIAEKLPDYFISSITIQHLPNITEEFVHIDWSNSCIIVDIPLIEEESEEVRKAKEFNYLQNYLPLCASLKERQIGQLGLMLDSAAKEKLINKYRTKYKDKTP